MREPGITVEAVSKRFGAVQVLDGISLEVGRGELVAVLGPSGSGKTTLLRLIAGLERPDDGRLMIGGSDMTATPAERRRVGLVFQHYNLFPHLDVARNIAFGMAPGDDQPARIEALLALVELDGLGRRRPHQLSGGQRQRAALARALAAEPAALLLDEPFGALDAVVRRSLRATLRRIHETAGTPTILVTHDQEEAMEMADRVVVLNHGVIEQSGAPQALYDHPASEFVFRFMGAGNRIEGLVTEGRFRGGGLTLEATRADAGTAAAMFRPHDVALEDGQSNAVICRITPSGPAVSALAKLDQGQEIELHLPRSALAKLTVGQAVRLRIEHSQIFTVSPAPTGE